MAGDPGSQAQAQEDKQRQVEDMKNSILSQVLTQEARARCKYIYIFRANYILGHSPRWLETLVIHKLNFLLHLPFSKYTTSCKARKGTEN